MSIGQDAKRRKAHNAPAAIIIEPHTLVRTTIIRLLQHELAGWDLIDMVSVETLDSALGMDVHLIALDMAGRTLASASLCHDLDFIRHTFPEASIALLSNTDDVLAASQALEMGIRGYFTTSIPIDIALAGMRLILPAALLVRASRSSISYRVTAILLCRHMCGQKISIASIQGLRRRFICFPTTNVAYHC